MHQFDEFESHAEPWAPCDNHGHGPRCQGDRTFSGRISCMLVFERLRERHDRVAVPLISLAGGRVVDPSVPIKCAYGDDGSTWRASGGCYSRWCDRNHPFQTAAGRSSQRPCGLGGKNEIDAAWRPRDLDKMLQLHMEHSQPYHPPRFYSGYNELIYDSATYNDALPRTIEAFFVVKNKWINPNGQTFQRHRRFLAQYGKSAEQVPLLIFDPHDWTSPFASQTLDSALLLDAHAPEGDSESACDAPGLGYQERMACLLSPRPHRHRPDQQFTCRCGSHLLLLIFVRPTGRVSL